MVRGVEGDQRLGGVFQVEHVAVTAELAVHAEELRAAVGYRHLGLTGQFPGDVAHRSSVLAVVFKLGQSLHSQTLSTAGVLGHLIEVDLLDVHGVVLLQDCLRPLDQPCHCPEQSEINKNISPPHQPFEHVLLAGLSDELILVLYHLCPHMLRPAALHVVHVAHLDSLGLGVHIRVSHGGVVPHTLLERLREDILPADSKVRHHLILSLGLTVRKVRVPAVLISEHLN